MAELKIIFDATEIQLAFCEKLIELFRELDSVLDDDLTIDDVEEVIRKQIRDMEQQAAVLEANSILSKSKQ